MDIRVYSTKNRIKAGLIKCIEQKPFKELLNKDIIAASEVSSRTFYQYYSDKNELLSDIETELITGLKQALAKDREILVKLDHVPDQKEIMNLAEAAFKNTIDYCADVKKMARVLLSDNGDISFLRMIKATSEQEFITRIQYLFGINQHKKLQDVDVPVQMILQIYVGTIVNTIIYWLRYDDSLSPREIRKVIGEVQVMSPFELLTSKAR